VPPGLKSPRINGLGSSAEAGILRLKWRWVCATLVYRVVDLHSSPPLYFSLIAVVVTAARLSRFSDPLPFSPALEDISPGAGADIAS